MLTVRKTCDKYEVSGRKHVGSFTTSSALSSLDLDLQNQKTDVQNKLESETDSRSISQIKRIIIMVVQNKPSRGASYIPTPEQYNNSRCGLISIKNDDGSVFTGV